MDPSIITAAISCGATLAVCLINNFFNMKRIGEEHARSMAEYMAQQQAKLSDLAVKSDNRIDDMVTHNEQSIAIMQCAIDELKRSVDKHNNLVERMYACESKLEVQEERQRVANNRISDIEKQCNEARKIEHHG